MELLLSCHCKICAGLLLNLAFGTALGRRLSFVPGQAADLTPGLRFVEPGNLVTQAAFTHAAQQHGALSAESRAGGMIDPSPKPDIFGLPRIKNVSTESDSEFSSLMAVTNWPRLKLFTYGQAAYSDAKQDLRINVPGSRVVVKGDPIPAGSQLTGFHHDGMVPVLLLDAHKDHDDFQLDGNRSVPNNRTSPVPDRESILSDHALERHSMSTYTSLLRQRLTQHTDVPLLQKLQDYRMAVLTDKMSYVDSNEDNIHHALDQLNAERNPLDPARPLYEKRLEHVRTFQFSSRARVLSKALSNKFGPALGMEAPIRKHRITHNVHLLKDAANDGYLTFQGTANLGTLIDVDFDMRKYDLEHQAEPFSPDDKWDLVAKCFLKKSHSGFAGALKAFVGHEEFPMLAAECGAMKSLSIVGHSLGGSLASMMAMCAKGAQNIQHTLFDLAEIEKPELSMRVDDHHSGLN